MTHKSGSFTWKHIWASFGLQLAIGISVATAAAAQTCIGPVTGVPANYTAPNWWQAPACGGATPDAGCAYWQSTDDPRWVGAGDVSFGDGTSNLVDFRSLQDSSFVYLSWRMTHATVDVHDDTFLYFAIQDPNPADTSTGVLLVKVNLKENTQNSDQPLGSWFQLNTFNSVAAGSPALLTPPSWTNTLRVWTNEDAPGVPDSNSWSVQVQIPRSSLNITGSTFKMWFQEVTPINVQVVAPVATLAWPTGSLITMSGFNNIYPDPSTWQTYQFSTGPNDPVCKTAGVSLALTSIGTYNKDPGTGNPAPQSVLFQASGASTPPPVNQFFAYPQNNTGSPIAKGAILATFRIADWGSNPNGWETGVDSSVLWSTIPGGGDVPNSDIIPSGTIANTANQNTFNWTVAGADLTAFQTGARRADNCLLVDLKGAGANPVVFANNSIRRNMEFEQASTVTKKANISLKGLPAISPDGRDVYVWVETRNMPTVAPKNAPPAMMGTTIPGHFTDGQRGSGYSSGAGYVPPQPGTPIAIPNLAQLHTMLLAGQVTQSQIEAVVPMEIVHLYHVNGQTMRVGGVDRPVVVAQGSYGYYLNHSGSLYGWQHDLVGEGFSLEKLAPDFYVIRKMPNNGTVTLTSTIIAQEHGKRCDGMPLGGVGLFSLAGVALIGLLTHNPRKKNDPTQEQPPKEEV